MAKTEEFLGTGRRKTAVARVRLSASGSGKVTVNGRDVENYFTVENQRSLAVEPLETVEMNEKADVRVKVAGGGIAGQAGAVRLGIARALEKYNGELRQPLKDAGHLSRDPRKKERKKPGQPGARKRFQYSKR
ncbi:MAG: 30S ribosomal protein S9 [Verrucomicrobiota bacterium]|jgi:small subunit ribosomal protein S9|nr:30S ribosomal protein S9 [Verrucomicrobiota bacterium]MDP6252403.1 30S ribosomal protein S9 [Verrucomicrobiota bacterium]MDP7177102.1 30S ribosomal protein S9 [Verrucomicrobiota bacterium]MDP7291933.1 30S ribosomal protein S9 [Verrucomicrobiota bacterium]MDP7440118.1 30S ribosomal protein S9 [Verrucomicrobiota bacterium]|tara:strand:+ start:741 stop:1139 length:399 start_codon:yes stop_codon:yes gene_type:complete